MSEIKLTAKNNLSKRRFGRLIALAPAFKTARHYIVWTCQCDCGNTHEAIHYNLVSGNTKSCGCYMRDRTSEAHTKHGDTKFRNTYPIWMKMRQRCSNPRCRDYPNYGGRGIKVHPEWDGEGGYEAFMAHIGPRPSLAYSLDRIDPDKGYEPGNVRWLLKSEQNRNKRNSIKITYLGETKTLTEWAEAFGMKSGMLWHRVVKKKMPFHEAVSAPNEKPRRKVEYQGRQVTIKELAMLTGIDHDLLRNRIGGGWTVEKAVQPAHPKAPTMMIEYKGRNLSIGRWAKITGLDDQLIRKRIEKKGWSAEQALTTPSPYHPERFRHPDETPGETPA